MSAEQQEDIQTQEQTQQADGQERQNTKQSSVKEKQQKQRSSGKDQQQQQEEEQPSQVQIASMDLMASLKDTFTELGKTVRALLETVQSLLKSVAGLVKLIATALSEGLQRIGLPVGQDDSGGGIGALVQMVLHALVSFGKSIQARLSGGDEQAQPAESGS